MKKFWTIVSVAALALSLGGCARSKVIDGYTYEPYCVANQNVADGSVAYELNLGSVVMAVIFSETVIVPVYVLAVNCMEPVGKKLQKPDAARP